MTILNASPRANRRARSDVFASGPRAASRGFQIGPRIRVGGTVGKIGQAVKIGAGKIASNPLVEGLAGATLGPWASAGLGALGKTLDTSNGSVGLGDIAGGAVQGGAAGYAGSKLGGMLSGGIPGIGGAGAGASAGGAATSDFPIGDAGRPQAEGAGGAAAATDGGTGSSWLDRAKSIFSGTGSDGKGSFGIAGDLLGKLSGGASSMLGGQAGSGLDKILMGASIADAALTKKRQQDLQNKGLQYATDAFNANAPIRDRGRQLMLDERAPDLSSIFTNPKNPYNKTVPVPTVGSAVPVTPTALPRVGG